MRAMPCLRERARESEVHCWSSHAVASQGERAGSLRDAPVVTGRDKMALEPRYAADEGERVLGHACSQERSEP